MYRTFFSNQVQSRSSLLMLLVFIFVVSPKIDIIPLGGIGIRPEDLICLIAAFVVLSLSSWRAAAFPRLVKLYLLYLTICLLSAVVNFGSTGVTGFAFTLRQFQYMVWLLVGLELACTTPPLKTHRMFDAVSAVLLIWAAGELAGLIPKIGKFTEATQRITVNTSGPYEISVLALMLLLLSYNRVMKVGLFCILLLAQARVTLISAALVYFRLSPRYAVAISILGLLSFTALESLSLISATRLGQTDSVSTMWSTLSNSWDRSWSISNLEEYYEATYSNLGSLIDNNSDASFQIRATRWSFILKAVESNIIHVLLGWGPGAWGLAVDGNYVRILGEAGLAGLAAFAAFAIACLRTKTPRDCVSNFMLIILIAAIFIDVAVSSKIMSLFWVVVGIYCVRPRRYAVSRVRKREFLLPTS